MINPVVYIFLNKDLHMSVGKAAAQVAHATMEVNRMHENFSESWSDIALRTVIVLEARDENHMRNIERYVTSRGFKMHVIVDEGVNEIDPHTITAMSTDVLEKDDEHTKLTFSSFNLYRDTVKIKLEFDK